MVGTTDTRETRWVNPFSSTVPGLRHETFDSASMGWPVGYGLYLPQAYDKQNAHFPVIYWLHGMGGNESSGVTSGVPDVLHQAIESKQIPPTIMVLVNGTDISMFSDSFDGSIMAETAFIKELVPYIDNTYRTIPSREGRVIEGFSMGGYGAIKLAAKFPEMFSSVVSYAGALHTMDSLSELRGFIFQSIFNADPDLFREHSLYYWVRQNRAVIRESIPLRIVVGTDDVTFSYHQRFWPFLDELKIPYDSLVLEDYTHDAQAYYRSQGVSGFAFQVKNMKI